MFIGAPPDEQNGADATTAAYDLTPAETRVLAGLLAGRTLAETAVALGIAASTAKTHLDHIFAKTDVTRQADLMRLASARSSDTMRVPPARPPSPGRQGNRMCRRRPNRTIASQHPRLSFRPSDPGQSASQTRMNALTARGSESRN